MFISIICTWCFFLFGCVYGNSSVYPISRPHIPAAERRINGYVQWFGYAIAVGMLLYIGIKYMMASANEKADLKKGSISYVIGAIIVVAASTLFGILSSIAGEVVVS